MKECINCKRLIEDEYEYCPYCGSKCYKPGQIRNKSKIGAGLLAIFLGLLGIHNFYLGYNRKGFCQLLIPIITFFIALSTLFTYDVSIILTAFVVFFLVALFIYVWAFIEGIMIFMGRIKDIDGNDLI